ncbi:hypothetical protein ACFVUH_02670 [Kitasatospora sp. NPDC058032]|uniref:hypothetical protein n=1 Tax=Kitasatospora sp. NPDC058032 TaxID=3346307 RepID=UPI0036DCB9D2
MRPRRRVRLCALAALLGTAAALYRLRARPVDGRPSARAGAPEKDKVPART